MTMMNEKDKEAIAAKGITEAAITTQLNRFEEGFPFLKIEAVATIGNGIKQLSNKEIGECTRRWAKFKSAGGSVEKFVPASGAASRMFKNMFAFVASGNTEPTTDFEKRYFDNIDKFAFYGELNRVCKAIYQKDVHQLINEGKRVEVVKAILEKNGLNYGFLPKALLKFHRAAGGTTHTSLEEHLEECAQYAADRNNLACIHFTVSTEHRKEFEKLLGAKIGFYEKVWGVSYKVTMSEQKSSTDTIAVNLDNTPFRDENGNLVFRPAGHGALIENLNEQEADVVFVKNIDNVVPSRLRHTTIRYKKVIGGYLVKLQHRIAKFMKLLDEKAFTPDQLKEMLEFLEKELCTVNPKAHSLDNEQLADYLRLKFNRPIRVCGVVKNEGEPGGGPYLAYNKDGSYSPQILESSQIDNDDPVAVQLMNSGTHFNPVDIVCYLKDYKGDKFNLKDFVDLDTGLISNKSVNGISIKALELPGLWNGSMSDWNTAFVEVPIETFNPVKTVNDLLRAEHQ